MAENYKHLYEQMKKMVEKYQDEIVPGLRDTIDNLRAKGINSSIEWVSVADDKPADFVSVLGHMTDAGDFPAVRECYLTKNGFYFPALFEIHPVDKWAYMPDPQKYD